MTKEYQINSIIFDMGHVFIDFEWSEVIKQFKNICSDKNIDFEDIMKQLANLGYEAGMISTKQFIYELNRITGLNLNLNDFTSIWNYGFTQNTDMIKLMSQLKMHYPLYLLSNTNENHFDYLENKYSISKLFSGLVLSYKVGYVKPQPEIYYEVLKLAHCEAQNCIFIDDLPENVESAKRIGINSILFKGYDDLKQELANFSIKA